MYKAMDKGDETKVVGRWLYIGEHRYNSENISEDLANEMNTGSNKQITTY